LFAVSFLAVNLTSYPFFAYYSIHANKMYFHYETVLVRLVGGP